MRYSPASGCTSRSHTTHHDSADGHALRSQQHPPFPAVPNGCLPHGCSSLRDRSAEQPCTYSPTDVSLHPPLLHCLCRAFQLNDISNTVSRAMTTRDKVSEPLSLDPKNAAGHDAASLPLCLSLSAYQPKLQSPRLAPPKKHWRAGASVLPPRRLLTLVEVGVKYKHKYYNRL